MCTQPVLLSTCSMATNREGRWCGDAGSVLVPVLKHVHNLSVLGELVVGVCDQLTW